MLKLKKKKHNSGAKGLITKINVKKLIENLKTDNKFLFAQISALQQLTLESFSYLRFSTIHHVVIAELLESKHYKIGVVNTDVIFIRSLRKTI